MNQNLECEARNFIDEETFNTIKNELLEKGETRHFFQTNYYFDDEFYSLNNHHRTLRVRIIENEKSELTIKIKGKDGDIEYNEPLDLKRALRLVENFEINNEIIKQEILKITKEKIFCLGHLRTERFELKHKKYLFVLDKNEYFDVVDFNIEVEAKNKKEAEKYLKKLLKKYKIKKDEKYLGKSKRFLKEYIKHSFTIN